MCVCVRVRRKGGGAEELVLAWAKGRRREIQGSVVTEITELAPVRVIMIGTIPETSRAILDF